MIPTIQLRKFTDPRGWLVENTKPEIMASVKHFLTSVSKPGVIRGNHYHERKIEWFFVLNGTCRYVTEDIVTKKREELIIHEGDVQLIQTVPNIAHAMQNIGTTDMYLLGLVNEVLDREAPDTYAYTVIK